MCYRPILGLLDLFYIYHNMYKMTDIHLEYIKKIYILKKHISQ